MIPTALWPPIHTPNLRWNLAFEPYIYNTQPPASLQKSPTIPGLPRRSSLLLVLSPEAEACYSWGEESSHHIFWTSKKWDRDLLLQKKSHFYFFSKKELDIGASIVPLILYMVMNIQLFFILFDHFFIFSITTWRRLTAQQIYGCTAGRIKLRQIR